MRLRRRAPAAPALNITPLIDVVFMLLVFFMLAINFARFRLIGVESPQQNTVVRTSEGAVVILLKADGSAEVDGDPAAREDIAARVSAIIAVDPNRSFLVRPEPGVSLNDAIAGYDAARDGGADLISFSRPFREDTQ